MSNRESHRSSQHFNVKASSPASLSESHDEVSSNHVSIEYQAATDAAVKECELDPRKENADQTIRWSHFRIAGHVHSMSHGQRSSRLSTTNSHHQHHHRSHQTNPRHQWSSEDFDVSTEVGKGHYGVVVKARRKVDRERVALKRISKQRIEHDFRSGGKGKALKLIKREIDIHSR